MLTIPAYTPKAGVAWIRNIHCGKTNLATHFLTGRNDTIYAVTSSQHMIHFCDISCRLIFHELLNCWLPFRPCSWNQRFQLLSPFFLLHASKRGVTNAIFTKPEVFSHTKSWTEGILSFINNANSSASICASSWSKLLKITWFIPYECSIFAFALHSWVVAVHVQVARNWLDALEGKSTRHSLFHMRDFEMLVKLADAQDALRQTCRVQDWRFCKPAT